VRRPAGVVSAGVRYRLGVASRAVAAIAGGYGVAALSAALLALCLPPLFGTAHQSRCWLQHPEAPKVGAVHEVAA